MITNSASCSDLIAADELALLVDESGDTALRDPANRLFALGGALVAGPDVELISKRWLLLREMVLGNPEAKLHMAEHSVLIREERQAYLLEVLSKSPFARIGISVTQSTNVRIERGTADSLLDASLNELLTMHGEMAPYCLLPRMAVLFEHSPLSERLARLCQGLAVHANGQPVPLRVEHVTKAKFGPIGEIADCIAHTVCAYSRTSAPEAFIKDRWDAIFKPINRMPARHIALSAAVEPKPTTFS